MKKDTKKVLVNLIIITVVFVPLYILASMATPAGESEHGAHGFDWEGLVLAWYNFTILIYLLVKFAGPMIKDMFKNRSEEIRLRLEEAEAMKKQAEALIAEYNAKLKELEETKDKELARYREEAEREQQEILARAEEQIKKIEQDMQVAIEARIKIAKETLQRQLAQGVVEEAERLIREEISEADHARLVDKTIDNIDKMMV